MLLDKAAAKLTYAGWSMVEAGRRMDTPSESWFDNVAWGLSRKRLDRYLRHNSIPDHVNAIEAFRGFGAYPHMKALHNPAETTALASKVQQLAPKVIVEIGTCWGGTLFVWARSNPQAELIVSMDLPGGLYGGGYHANRIKMYEYFVHDRPQTRLELLRCDTHQPESRRQLSETLQGRPIDFLFIDGDHTFDGVAQDFEMYSGFVRPNGLVAFHDINTLQSDHHVHRFWNDLKRNFAHEEIIADPGQGKYGIGVLTMPSRFP
jgi:predicted O-methyltransferase YrrM